MANHLKTPPNKAANAGWRRHVRLRGSRHWSGVAELLS
jgi:hypothetical protein